ncbi:MAG: hypothetical protein U0R78_00625 [Nocardioidaceae bacterium]
MTDGLAIIVIVGTDHHPFERMVGWVDDRLDVSPRRHGDHPARVVARARRLAEGLDFLAPDDLRRRMAEADVVITTAGRARSKKRHDGRSTAPSSCRAVPLGEHVDDHQQRFAAWCAERGVVEALAMTIDALEGTVGHRGRHPDAAETAAETDAAVAAFAALVALPHHPA